ncbi:LysR family transcriptional regulator [Sphingopyxis sp. JAI128]|uniref:LysR family transcriptional regulator n=1 Tax=Sphingopyxis sp. JAI128 TaxID=2723066 RepID=UPI0016187EBE|nr:LysR family transcriptional regulator [Sphingopyxis sp. JAI128]MBB6425234.1 DNA-binding transcriptional LysR family regulator [Sphingopyxis sp. JAI128]
MSANTVGPQLLRGYTRVMRFCQIEVFHAVYTHGSISAAARALGVSQPSVSKTLRHAEDSLGFPLFQLARGRLVPTDEAHALIREAGDVFDRLASLQQTARNLSQAGGGHIRLGIVPSLALDVVPQAIAQFRRDWPRVTFEVHTHHHDDLVRSLIERETDIAIAYTPPAHPRLTRALLTEGELVAFGPTGAFGQVGDRLPLGELADRDLIGVAATGPIGDVLTRAARERGIAYREAVSVQTFFIAARLAQLEGGVTVVDEFTARAWQAPGFSWHRTEPPLGFTISWVTLEDRPPSKVARLFLRTLEEVLAASRTAKP